MPTTSGARDAHPRYGREPGESGGAPPVELRVLRVSAYRSEAERDLPLLSAEERERGAAFRLQADRDRYHVAHTALRRELAARLGCPPADVPLTRAECPVCGGPHGRPSVAGHPVHFSLSHAGDLVVLAFAGRPVGVDVEREPDPSVVTEVARALHPREQVELAALPEARRGAAFARCWTRKEAYLKGTGTGLAEDPAVTYVGTGPEPVAPSGWRVADVVTAEGYAAAWALGDVPPPDLP